MKTVDLTDRELFRQALTEAFTRKFDEELAASPEEFLCSEQHLRRMKAIMERHAVMERLQARKRKLIVLLLAAVLLLLTACTVYSLRGKIRAFIETACDEHVRVTYQDVERIYDDDPFDEYYTLGYVPEGYIIKEDICTRSIRKVEWHNEDNNYIVFEQRILDSSHYLHVEQYEPVVVLPDGTRIYHRHTTVSVFLWNDGIYAYKLETSEVFTIDQIIKIIESVKQCD